MKIYIGFDDTDIAGADRGTGKFARWFEEKLPEGTKLWGVVRQQLPVLEGIPYTSQNSSACLIVDMDDPCLKQEIIDRAAAHIQEHFIEGSDPGLCVIPDNSPAVSDLIAFGREACTRIVTQKEAMKKVNGDHLSGHGGTNDGIIGAAAGVGLTLYGWSGRFIEFNGLREFGREVRVRSLEKKGIQALSIDRNALVPGPEDIIDTQNWLRPRLWGFRPVLPVKNTGHGLWVSVGAKQKHIMKDAA
jgi:tRNA(Ile2) C34 agmatinyltransferase TiaS